MSTEPDIQLSDIPPDSAEPLQDARKPSQRTWRLAVAVIVLAVILVAVGAVGRNKSVKAPSSQSAVNNEVHSNEIPELNTAIIQDGLDHPWDVGFLSDDSMLITQRSQGLFRLDNGKMTVVLKPTDLLSVGEGGMMGLAIDPDFASNHLVFVCMLARQSTKDTDVRLVKLQLTADLSGVEKGTDIITGLPTNQRGQLGRHSGCRPRFGPDDNLWIGTGDAATGTNPQDPQNLGGKILRVDREGKAVSGNQKAPFDERIYSYGHRNVQGLAFWPDGPLGNDFGVSLEHGPDRDDELNLLKPGNFGWDPQPGAYNEATPMTDHDRYPTAIDSVWESGTPTIAPSGATFITGNQWQGYDGALFVAMLKGEHVHVFLFNDKHELSDDLAILSEFGRVRSLVQGPDGDLYLTTDNGSNKDKLIKVSPKP